MPTWWSGLRPRREIRPDLLLATLLGLATFAVHNVGYIFSLPYWTDEAWVVVSTKLPLSDLPRVTASTPIGWTFLLRLVVLGGDERQRIVPLLFAALTVVAAYGYVRSLPWPGLLLARLAAVAAGASALLIPSALARDDLKQYTADAFFTVLILWMVSRMESDRSPGRRWQLAAVIVLGFLFSAVSLFVGVVAFTGLAVSAAFARRWREVREVLLVGAITGLALGVLFFVFYRPGIARGLNDYWAYYYVPISQGWSASRQFLSTGLQSLAVELGMGPLLVSGVLLVAGVVTLARLRRPALAIAAPALLVEMVVLSAARQYPLFDIRTSHFLTTALAVTAAIGFAGLCVALSKIHLALAVAATGVALVLFVQNVSAGIRAPNINVPASSVEDLRTPIAYLAAHSRPTDVVVVNANSNWGFGYYWNRGHPRIQEVTSNLQRFVVVFPDQPNIVVATDRDVASVDGVMARAMAAADRIGPSARIWFLHQHTIPTELDEYRNRASSLGLQNHSVIDGSLDLWTPSG